MLNPIHLETLRTVLRTGSFTDAGHELGYTGSAVSQQMSALERATGAQLFERDAHRVRPTTTAVFIAERAAEPLGRLQALEADVQSHLRGEIGTLRLGAFQSLSERLLPSAISAFRLAHPGVEIPLIEDTPAGLIPALEIRSLDLAVLYRYSAMRSGWPRGFPVDELFTEDHFILTGPDHPVAIAAEAPSLRPLHAETWISTGPSSTGTAMLRRLCARAGFEPKITYQSYNYATVQGLVAAGLGIALVPALGYTPLPGVVATRLDVPDAVREVHVMRSPTLLDAPWISMREALQRAAADLAATAPGIHLPDEKR